MRAAEQGPSLAGDDAAPRDLHLTRPSQTDKRMTRDTMISRAPRCYDLSTGALPMLRRGVARGQGTR